MLGSEVVLSIGLPLAAGLTLREMSGVLAHELGHFARRSGMRGRYLVRAIVNWFDRAVYERDQWDIWLDETSEDLEIRVGWVIRLARLFVMIGRGILCMLFHVGLTISGDVVRQLEFDADRYQARIAGSEVFAVTYRKVRLLLGGWQIADKQLSAGFNHRKLVDDLPGLIAHHARRAPPEARPRIDEIITGSMTNRFDTQPCDKDRISAVERLDAPGIFHMDRPASELFSDFHAQAAATTWDFYGDYFGTHPPRSALQPVPEFVAEQNTDHGLITTQYTKQQK
jgi:Zn-dependent protease with chaperone function